MCIFSRFPDLKKQFANAKAVRSWMRTGRIQYSSKRVVGERFALLGHAAGFIDPLFSKGLYVSFHSVSTLAHLILKTDGDFSAETFKSFEQQTQSFIHAHDRLAANSYKAFSNYKLWSAYKILWLLGAYTEFVKLTISRRRAKDRDDYYHEIQNLRLAGGGFDEFTKLADRVDTLIEQVEPVNEQEVDKTVAEITELFLDIDWLPDAFREALHGKACLPKNKLSWKLLRRNAGFMGQGKFRQHFFNNAATTDLVLSFMAEKINYSKVSILRKKAIRYNYLS